MIGALGCADDTLGSLRPCDAEAGNTDSGVYISISSPVFVIVDLLRYLQRSVFGGAPRSRLLWVALARSLSAPCRGSSIICFVLIEPAGG